MVKKKVDARIRTLIENGVKTKHRTLMLIVGQEHTLASHRRSRRRRTVAQSSSSPERKCAVREEARGAMCE